MGRSGDLSNRRAACAGAVEQSALAMLGTRELVKGWCLTVVLLALYVLVGSSEHPPVVNGLA